MKAIFIIFLFLVQLRAESLCVVTAATSSIDSLNQRELRDLFLMKKKFVTDNRVIVINLAPSDATRLAFEKNVLNMQRNQLNSYWVKKHFQGIEPPVSQASVPALKKFLQNVENSIGYLPKSFVDQSLKVLYEF